MIEGKLGRSNKAGFRLTVHGSNGKHITTIEKMGDNNPIAVYSCAPANSDIDKWLKSGIQIYIPPRGGCDYRWFEPNDPLFMHMLGIKFINYQFLVAFEEFFVSEGKENYHLLDI